MNAPASCADDHDPEALSPEAAAARIAAGLRPITGAERLALRSALGRVLAETVCAPFDVPACANSAIDGYAVRGEDLPADGVRELRVVGTALAGHPWAGTLGPGEAVRIMTGAPLPAGADTALYQERVERIDDRVRITPHARPGDNVRLAGEDIARGAVVLSAGRRLTPADLGLLASLGRGEVSVRRRLRVAFFSTGDELRSLGEPLEPGMLYDSNRYTLHGMLSRLDCELLDMGVVRDDPQALEAAFREAGGCADLVVTSGGVSVGEADYVKDMLARVGEVDFWKVAIKPGRPLAFGRIGEAVFFGLPGNPVSVMATFHVFVRPAIHALRGETPPLTLTVQARVLSRLKKRPGRVEYQRGILTQAADGTLEVDKTGAQGSGVLSSMSRANCFIVLSHDCAGVEAGSLVDVQPFGDAL